MAAFVAKAQIDTVFSSTKNFESTEYVFNIPSTWKHIDKIDQSSKDEKFDFTGVGIPTEYKMMPLTASFTLKKHAFDSLPPALNYVINEITAIPDRVTPAGENYKQDTLTIASGQTIPFLSTHYFRHSKVSNFTRFDVIAYNKKRKAAYVLTALFQYRDPSYGVENTLKLKEYVTKVFRSLILR